MGALLLGSGHFTYVAMCITAMAFSALASVLKDRVFRRARERLGANLDVFVVNSFASLFQVGREMSRLGVGEKVRKKGERKWEPREGACVMPWPRVFVLE